MKRDYIILMFGCFIGFLISRLSFIDAFLDSISPLDVFLFGGLMTLITVFLVIRRWKK